MAFYLFSNQIVTPIKLYFRKEWAHKNLNSRAVIVTIKEERIRGKGKNLNKNEQNIARRKAQDNSNITR